MSCPIRKSPYSSRKFCCDRSIEFSVQPVLFQRVCCEELHMARAKSAIFLAPVVAALGIGTPSVKADEFRFVQRGTFCRPSVNGVMSSVLPWAMSWKAVMVGFGRLSTRAAMCSSRLRSWRGILSRWVMTLILRPSERPSLGRMRRPLPQLSSMTVLRSTSRFQKFIGSRLSPYPER